MPDAAAQSESGRMPDATEPDIQPSVGVVVLHWNRVEETTQCIQSLSRLQYRRFQIFVVDNGSEISLDSQLAVDIENLSIIRSRENLGFAGGCNLGIRASVDAGCDFVWLLNNDAVVDPDALRYLVEVAKDRPAAGIVGSTILERDNGRIVNHVGGQLKPYSGLTVHLGKGESYPLTSAQDKPQPSFVTGCSMLACLPMMRDVGLMDEGYFLYWEDVDWCVRARRKGWDIAVAYKSVVYHKGSSSVGYGSPLKSYYLARNSIRFVWKLYPWLLPVSLVWWPRRHFLNHIWRGRYLHAKMSLRALFDALFRRVIVPQVGQGDAVGLEKKVIRSESWL
jgi:GT2 family glycosyltransferase